MSDLRAEVLAWLDGDGVAECYGNIGLDDGYEVGAEGAFVVASRTVLPLALVALRGEIERHSRFGIYDECGHDHAEDEQHSSLACRIDDVGWVCEEGLVQSVCRECHTDDGEPREDTDEGAWPCDAIKRIHAATVGHTARVTPAVLS